MEQRHRRSVEVEFGGDSLFSLGRFVSKHFLVGRSLQLHVASSWDWLRGGDVSVGVDVPGFLGRLAPLVLKLTVAVFLKVYFLGWVLSITMASALVPAGMTIAA